MASLSFVSTAWRALQQPNVLAIDVRSANEYNAQHIPGTLNIPHVHITDAVSRNVIPSWRDVPLLLFCRSGNRSEMAAKTLRSMGYSNVYNGGTWRDVTEAARALSLQFQGGQPVRSAQVRTYYGYT